MAVAKYVPQQAVKRAAMLAWTARLKAITPEALAERNAFSIAEAQEHLDVAVRLELMEQKSILVGYSALFTVTPYGRSIARKHADAGGYTYPEGLRKCLITIGGARHMIACVSAAAALERRYPDHRICGEHELRKDEHEHGRRLITMDIQTRSGRRFHSPDLVIWPPSTPGEPPPLPVAVEVELNLKNKDELPAICRALARCRHIEGTVYFVENTKIEDRLLDVIEQLKAEETIVVNPLSAIVQSLPGFELAPWEADA